ncbi:hypothetical protein QTP88_015794 [Uroleucon formosanum]
MVDIGEKISSFKQKLALWWEKLFQEKIATFPLLSEILEDSTKVTLNDLRLLLQEYLDKLQIELDRYIPENVELSKYSWVRNPFEISVHEVGEDICGFQEELLDLQASQVLKENFSRMCLTQFWAQLKDKPILSRESENALLPFPTTYLCEAGFSTLVVVKTNVLLKRIARKATFCPKSLSVSFNIYCKHFKKTILDILEIQRKKEK